jgi:hypothetical protein
MGTPHGEHMREIDNRGENAEHCRWSFDLLIVVRWLGRPLARACDRLKMVGSSLRFEGRVSCVSFRGFLGARIFVRLDIPYAFVQTCHCKLQE